MSGPERARVNIVWDMETMDPDDYLTLLLLLGHPQVNLKAVTITPGSQHQVGFVRAALAWFGREALPVGAFNLAHEKTCVSSWHYKAYGDIPPSQEAEPGAEVLLRCCDEQTTLLTGAPLKNLGRALALAQEREQPFKIGRLVTQGGFAGEGVVPPELQIARFRGLTTCPTFNLNGDPRSALAALASPQIGIRRFVSKNVCHRVFYDHALHAQVAAIKDQSRSLQLIWQGMEVFLHRPSKQGQVNTAGKKLHDPLAACCAIDETIGTWAEVELYREHGAWGSRLAPGSNTWIIVDYHRERFLQTLLAV